jgi:glycosyltransferase involved in cell wall biosynthesis
MISYTSFLQRFYQSLPNEIAQLAHADVRVVVPPYWIELWSGGRKYLEKDDTTHFRLETGKILFTGNLHFSFFYTQLAKTIREFQPHIIDMDNEPFNAGSFQIARCRQRYASDSKLILHASQHLFKRYPPPFNFIESYCLRQANAILVRNEMARSVLLRKGYRGRIELITHGVDTDVFFPEPCMDDTLSSVKKEKPIIGFVGSLVKHKGLDLLFHAVRDIPCKVVLVGDGDQKDILKSLAQTLNIDTSFMSALSHADVAKTMKCFDLFVLPSVTQSNWIEKFGRVLIEAMACGCTVIGSSCGEIPNVIGDSGLVFRENDSDDLRLKIQMAIGDNEKRKKLGEKARERVLKYYSWPNIARSTLDVYLQLLDENGTL